MTQQQLLDVPHRRRLPIQRLGAHAQMHRFSLDDLWEDVQVDRERLFIPPALTPLYHTDVYGELSRAQQRRYNQLVGMLQNEVIRFFERTLTASLNSLIATRSLGEELRRSLRQFHEDEAKHSEMFLRLNRACEPAWYANGANYLTSIPWPVRRALALAAHYPLRLPVVLWVMLLMEERSLLISRLYSEMRDDEVEPHYAAAYRAHLEEEVRHVQIDWHLIEHLYSGRSTMTRRTTAALLKAFVAGFFMSPPRSNLRIVDILCGEFPEIRVMRPRLIDALRKVAARPSYRRVMCSKHTAPIAFSLFSHFPEFKDLRKLMDIA